MALRMPCPIKRSGSDNWYFRRKLPIRVQRALATIPRKDWPAGWSAKEVVLSLRTSDRDETKTKCLEVAALVDRQMKAILTGPQPLTPKQIAGLSGVAYKAFTEGLEDDPVLSASRWREVAEMNRDADAGAYGLGAQLGIFGSDAERRAFSLESRFGAMVDAVLRTEGIVTDAASRTKLIEALARDLTEAAEKLARNADGDFTPDAYAQRFPAWEKPATTSSGKPDAKKPTISGLGKAWYDAALARGVRPRSAKRWLAVVDRFVQAIRHDDLSRVTLATVQRWGNERNAAGIGAKTINDADFAALRGVFGWGRRSGWLDTNPAEGARIDGRGKRIVREKYYGSDEAIAVLKRALAVTGTSREDPKTTAAKRWVPWLCAYSGARVAEMIQVRKQDVREEAGGWVLRLTPAAGGIKTDEFRDVPLHEHLIALGFLDFVRTAAAGHLFVTPRKDGSIEGPVDGVSNRIRTMVREVVADRDIAPNHAWRHTFKTVGYESGVPMFALDAICGHAARTQGEAYTRVTLKKRMEAMAKFPRYPVG